MSHPRKKGGQRKDHKNARMHEGEAFRKAMAHEPKVSTDQKDIVSYKSGSQGDDNRQPRPNQG